MIQLENYIMNFQKHTLTNTITYHMYKGEQMNRKYKSKKLFLDRYDYRVWSENK